MGTKKKRSQRRKKGNVGGAGGEGDKVGEGSSGACAAGGGGGGGGGDGDGWTIAGAKKKVDPKMRTYFKVFASFKCSNDRCKKTWHSAHGWEREDDEGGINCELCDQPAELIDAKDEMLKLNTYLCPTPNCFNRWHSIHVEDNPEEGLVQDCDTCGKAVSPEGGPQERFGRHYWLRCLNEECPEKDCVEWEDFSLTQQKTQRCTKCYSRGDIFKVSKLKQLPFWMWKRNKDKRGRGGGAGGEGDRGEESPSNHVTQFCDMCQDIIRQGKGKNCRQWRVIKTKLVKDGEGGGDGGEEEKIVEMGHYSENPFHYDVRGSKELEERAKEGQRQFVRNICAAAGIVQ